MGTWVNFISWLLTITCILRHKHSTDFWESPFCSVTPPECLTFIVVHELREPHSPEQITIVPRTQTLAGRVPIMAMPVLPTFHTSKCARIPMWERNTGFLFPPMEFVVNAISVPHWYFSLATPPWVADKMLLGNETQTCWRPLIAYPLTQWQPLELQAWNEKKKDD